MLLGREKQSLALENTELEKIRTFLKCIKKRVLKSYTHEGYKSVNLLIFQISNRLIEKVS